MATFPVYNPIEGLSAPLYGMSSGLSFISSILDIKTQVLEDVEMSEIFISDSDRYRLFSVPAPLNIWLESPSPVIKINGVVVSGVEKNFILHPMGGCVEFRGAASERPLESDVLTASFTCVNGDSSKIEEVDKSISDVANKILSFKGVFESKETLKNSITNPSAFDYALVFGEEFDWFLWDPVEFDWVRTDDSRRYSFGQISGRPKIANGSEIEEGQTLTASDFDAVPTSRTINGKALDSDVDITLTSLGGVPTTRTVNNKPLSSNISLTSTDVGAVPTSRTVNGKALTGNISLTPTDIGAENKIQYGTDLIGKTTVLSAVMDTSPPSSFFAVSGSSLLSASDSPFPSSEIEYQVFSDNDSAARRLVVAYGYSSRRVAIRSIFNGSWNTTWLYQTPQVTAQNGLSMSADGTIAMASANGATPGTVSAGTQTFNGNKTFTGQVVVGNPAVSTQAARKIYAGTADMTHGVTALATGVIYIKYKA